MKATELRIGNLIYENVLGIVTVSVIESELVWVDAKNMTKAKIIEDASYHLDIASIIGIPLTEEWLMRFGFNIKEEIWFSKKTNTTWTRFEVSLKDKRCILFDMLYNRIFQIDSSIITIVFVVRLNCYNSKVGCYK